MGICLGMQILFEKGYEVEETKGLGFLDGEVVFMDIDEKVPHMGWNQLHFNQNHHYLKNIHEMMMSILFILLWQHAQMNN